MACAARGEVGIYVGAAQAAKAGDAFAACAAPMELVGWALRAHQTLNNEPAPLRGAGGHGVPTLRTTRRRFGFPLLPQATGPLPSQGRRKY